MNAMTRLSVPALTVAALFGLSHAPLSAGGYDPSAASFLPSQADEYGQLQGPKAYFSGFKTDQFYRDYHGVRGYNTSLTGTPANAANVGAPTLAIDNAAAEALPRTILVRDSRVVAPGGKSYFPEPPLDPNIPPAGQPTYIPGPVIQPAAVPQTFTAPPAALAPPSVPPAFSAPNVSAGQCLQVREYQTTVVIGGVEREAYGPACLQPDGSWLQGPSKIAPFDN